MKTTRLLFLAASAAIALGAVALACTAGDPISYVNANDGGGPGPGGEGGLTDVATRDAPEQPDSTVPQLSGGPIGMCGDSVTVDASDDGGPAPCDPSAGEGCCFIQGTGTCYKTVDVLSDAGAVCHQPGNFFQTCGADTQDSPCCWGKGAHGELYTRYAADCGELPHACEPNSTCFDGTPCQTTNCQGAMVGYCGSVAPCP